MGAIRTLPENQVKTYSQKHKGFYFVTASVCGWQFFMEDFPLQITNYDPKLFAVIDGHNGPEVAEFCSRKLPQIFSKNELVKMHQIQSGLEAVLFQLQEMLFNHHEQLNEIRVSYNLPALTKDEVTRSGCSLALACITEQQIVIANIGMCRCYATYKKDKSKAILFSGNHITSNKDEESRIIKNNGFIYDGKINGMYPYTRSIGDLQTKKSKQQKKDKDKSSQDGLIISEPSFFCLRREDIFSLIIGSSGFWQKNQKVSQALLEFGKSQDADKQKLQQLISRMISNEPIEDKLGLQNMTATYINFNG